MAGWPADCHVIGKDIVRFHCIYWPALLLAMHLPLPKRVLTHSHWTLGRRKMSKSTGMVVNPFFAIDRFGVDCMRWFLILNGRLQDDAAYDNGFIIKGYKKGLQGGLGNLTSRIIKGKGWSVRDAIARQRLSSDDELDQKFQTCLRSLPASIAEDLEKPNPGDGLAKVMNVIYDTNIYLAQTKPWDLVQEHEKNRLDEIIYLCSESLRICGIMLQPFMPRKMEKLLDMLGVAGEARLFSSAGFGSDRDYGVPKFHSARQGAVGDPAGEPAVARSL